MATLRGRRVCWLHHETTTVSPSTRKPNVANAALDERHRDYLDWDVEAFELAELDKNKNGAGGRSHPEDAQPSRGTVRDRLRWAKLWQLYDEVEMKFSHSIQFNAVPDWSSHYIAYSNLKKV